MKAHIDYQKCTGMGMCEGIAEDVFEVSEDGQARVLVNDVPEHRRDEMDEAVAQCPTEAISLSD
jgi:ferredoxin